MATVSCDGAAALVNCGLTLDKFMKSLLVRLPGAPTALVKCELQHAVRDWYHRSLSWLETIGPFNVTDGQQFIWLNPVDAYANVQHVLGAQITLDGEPVELERKAAPTVSITRGRPRSYYCVEPAALQLFPEPDADYGRVLYLRCALVPVVDTERLPEIAVTHHFEGILSFALARLYAIPQKPWTNLELAAFYDREGRRRCSTARDEANRGHTRRDTPRSFPFFA